MDIIRKCGNSDLSRIYFIINESAKAYEGSIPPDCYHQPYMPLKELEGEFKRMTFYGWNENGALIGVMGFEPVKGVNLIRHAYVFPEWQNKKIGTELLKYLIALSGKKRLLVGMWSANQGAIRFYERNGFKLRSDKNELLKIYWSIPERQIETSIVMELLK